MNKFFCVTSAQTLLCNICVKSVAFGNTGFNFTQMLHRKVCADVTQKNLNVNQ